MDMNPFLLLVAVFGVALVLVFLDFRRVSRSVDKVQKVPHLRKSTPAPRATPQRYNHSSPSRASKPSRASSPRRTHVDDSFSSSSSYSGPCDSFSSGSSYGGSCGSSSSSSSFSGGDC